MKSFARALHVDIVHFIVMDGYDVDDSYAINYLGELEVGATTSGFQFNSKIAELSFEITEWHRTRQAKYPLRQANTSGCSWMASMESRRRRRPFRSETDGGMACVRAVRARTSVTA